MENFNNTDKANVANSVKVAFTALTVLLAKDANTLTEKELTAMQAASIDIEKGSKILGI